MLPRQFNVCALAIGLLSVCAAAQERLERYVERFGSADLAAVRAIDALWPEPGLRKIDELAFRRAWTRHFGPEQEIEALSRLFRRLQAIDYGIRAKDCAGDAAALERLRPVPRSGARPFVAPPPAPEALLLESEPNEDPARANPMTCADQMQGALLGIEDRDVFRVTVAAPSRFVARVDPEPTSNTPLLDPILELLAADGVTLAFSDDWNGNYPQLDLLLPAGTWYFRVAAYALTMNGDYRFAPSCTSLPVLDASAPLQGALGASERTGFALFLAQDDAFRLAATPFGPERFEIELIDRDGLRSLAQSRVGASSGEAALRTALRAGTYFVRLTELGGQAASFQATLAPSGTGIPVATCSAGTLAIDVGGESSPALIWQPSGIAAGAVQIKEVGWPHGTGARIDASDGRPLASWEAAPESLGTLQAVVGPGALLGFAARNAGLPAVSWRDAAVARAWSRPQPSESAYAGPTDLRVDAQQGFVFADDHVSASGLLTLRLRTDFDVEAGGWDWALFVDHCFVEVETQLTRRSFAPQAVRWVASGQAAWAGNALLGGPAELLADDDLYLAANLADASAEAREQCTLELDFDLTSLGVTGSQISALRFFAEWYFAGNASLAGTTAPPRFDDSSEEANVFARSVELARHAAATWDELGTAMPFEDRVEISPSCAAIPQQFASAEDAALAQLDASTPLRGFAFSARSPARIAAIAEPRSPAPWRGSTAAAAWRAPGAQHPGPIRNSAAAPLPAGVVGPQSVLRLRLRWEACWDEQIWDVHHYYDYARLEFDLGAGPLSVAPRSLSLGPDAARFRGFTGVTFATGSVADLASDDGVYARARREDYDSAAFGSSAEHWDELEFDLSPWLAPSGGAAFQALAAELELYRNGAGALAAPSSASGSEELLLRSDLQLEIFDFGSQTWLPLAGAPLITGYPFSTQCAPVGIADPELYAFDLRSGAALGRDDDGGGGISSRLELEVGDFATGESDTLFVAGISPRAGSNDRGAIALRIEAPFGYAGIAPYELVLGSPFVVVQRGTSGLLAFGWHSYLPNLPAGIQLGSPTEGFFVLDPAGFFLALPNGQVLANGSTSAALPTPPDPFLVGAAVHGQGLLFDPLSGVLSFSNEDRVVFRL